MKPIKVAQCLIILLIIQIVNCKKAEKSRSKKVKKTNTLLAAVYDNIAEQYDDIDEFEAVALGIQNEAAKHGQAMTAVMAEYNRVAFEEITELRADARDLDIDIDTEECFQDYSNTRFFLRDAYNDSVVTMKTEMWTDFSKYYQSFMKSVDDQKERVKEAHRDVVACDDDDEECFDDAWEEMQEVHGLSLDGMADIKSKNILYQVMKYKFFEKWESKMQQYLDYTFRDEDSALADFRACVRNQTMEWARNDMFSSASSTKRVDL